MVPRSTHRAASVWHGEFFAGESAWCVMSVDPRRRPRSGIFAASEASSGSQCAAGLHSPLRPSRPKWTRAVAAADAISSRPVQPSL